MARKSAKNHSRFRESLGAYAPNGFATLPAGARLQRLPWTELVLGAVFLVVGFTVGIKLSQPHTATAVGGVTPTASAATFGTATSALKATAAVPAATSGATTLQAGQTGASVQGTTASLQNQPAAAIYQGTVSASQLQGTGGGPSTIR